jgi:LemA protein
MNFTRKLMGLMMALGLASVLAGCGYNTIPTQDQEVKARWADVQAAYQRRADLIPNLVNTVAAYAAQERSVLTAVTEARASATQVKIDASTISDPAAFERFQAAQDRLSGVLGRLMAISEQYPDLKSNTNFLALQSQLEGTENRIEIARRDYNAAVQAYNTTLVTLPGSIWHSLAHSSYKQATPFAASAAAQQAPVVNFNNTMMAPQGNNAMAPQGGAMAPQGNNAMAPRNNNAMAPQGGAMAPQQGNAPAGTMAPQQGNP